MPADLSSELLRMLGCGLTVAAVAAPVGLIAWGLARRAGATLLPRPKPWRVPWTGFEVIVAFFLLNALVPMLVSAALSQSGLYQQVYGSGFHSSPASPGTSFESTAAAMGSAAAAAIGENQAEAAAVRGLWVGLVSLPIQIVIIFLSLRLLWPSRLRRMSQEPPAAHMALAVIGWVILTPIVLLIHTAVNFVFARQGWAAEAHPLSHLSRARPAFDQVLFFVQAAAAAPLIEEILFRGVLLGWLFGGRSMFDLPPGSSRRPPADRRVWPVLLIGLVMAFATTREASWMQAPVRGAPIFAIILLLGWIALRFITRRKRTLGAIYASAALFAVVHSEVWPTPIPLFILGLGLGWLALRTRGILAPAIVHGLFNAVSVLFVLRGSPM